MAMGSSLPRGAALCCAAACLSNAVGAAIPLLIVAWMVLASPRPPLRKILFDTFALWLIAAATVLVKALGPEREITAQLVVTPAQRLSMILTVYWLNVKAIVWPVDLAIARSESVPAGLFQQESLLGALALALTCALLWRLRRRRLAMLGLIWFGLALAPASQILNHHIPRADRFLYLPLAGLAISLAVGLRPLGSRCKGLAAGAAIAAGATGLLLLSFLDSRSSPDLEKQHGDVGELLASGPGQRQGARRPRGKPRGTGQPLRGPGRRRRSGSAKLRGSDPSLPDRDPA